ncbi:MAG: hypothetical protein V1862_02305 [Methanobacteriota archaeon]
MPILSSAYHSVGLSRYFLVTILFFSAFTGFQPASALIFLHNGSEITDVQVEDVINTDIHGKYINPFPIQFFYDSRCSSCKGAEEYLHYLEKKNPAMSIEFLNLINQNPNQQLYDTFKADYNRSDVHYPVLFLGDVGISGSSDIIWKTESLARAYLKDGKES